MTTYQLVGIGNAIVDVISQTEDAFLTGNGIEKGIMQLVEQDRAELLYGAMTNRVQTPGGSVANTIAGAGALGLNTAFIGRVRDDELGHFYANAMNEDGVDFVNPPAAGGELPTSRSMIFVSPDGERSMNTYLGISSELSSDDVPSEVAGKAELMFLEGYLFDKDKGKEAFLEAARDCHKGGGKIGIAISDPFCVDRHRDDFLSLIEHQMDFVIGNEAEIQSLFQTDHLDDALVMTAALCPLVVCTRSGDGVTVMEGTSRIDVPVQRITPIDATGAGDQFAAGFLYGMATDRDLETCARIGNVCAREVISHIGPRPETNVAELLRDAGLL
ncbi:adenosine kinase [Antarcticimicrobium sediminis]|uniref:Adenosine kinase n=1 Tax=Antarcticimicrobium sediminis TaxID=2546227 RepID=A0A4R5EVX6_9RHOB|nr:adenosine kinase [Antarcticimicrobium sediminis]TDE38992.1 adenosine kinase [Antarcticimicrobium sediminis]